MLIFQNKLTTVSSKHQENYKNFWKIPTNLYNYRDLTPQLRRILLLVFATLFNESTDLSRISFRFNQSKSQKRLKESLAKLKDLGFIEINDRSFDKSEIRVNYSKFEFSRFKNIPRSIAKDLRLIPAMLDVVAFNYLYEFKPRKNLSYCSKVMGIDPKTYVKHVQENIKLGFIFTGCVRSKRVENSLNRDKLLNVMIKHRTYRWTNKNRDEVATKRVYPVNKVVNNSRHFSAHIYYYYRNKIKLFKSRKLRLINHEMSNKKPIPIIPIPSYFKQTELKSIGSFLDLMPNMKFYILKSIRNNLDMLGFKDYPYDLMEKKIEDYALELDEKGIERTFSTNKQFISYMTKVIGGVRLKSDNSNGFGYDDALKPENAWFVKSIYDELKDVEHSNYSETYILWKIKVLHRGRKDFRMFNQRLLKNHIKKFLVSDTKLVAETEGWDPDYTFFDWNASIPSENARRILEDLRDGRGSILFKRVNDDIS